MINNMKNYYKLPYPERLTREFSNPTNSNINNSNVVENFFESVGIDTKSKDQVDPIKQLEEKAKITDKVLKVYLSEITEIDKKYEEIFKKL